MIEGATYSDALAVSQRWTAASGAMPVHAFNQVETVLGAGTVGLELRQQAPSVDTVLAAIGGGGGTLTAPEFDITGGYATTGGAQFSGQINLGRRPMADPLADLPAPDPTTMISQSNKKIQFTQGAQTLSPGVYHGGISVSGTGSLTLQPGISLAAARREERFAAIRLVGGTPRDIGVFASVEAAVSAFCGAILGILVFLLVKPVLADAAVVGSALVS